MSMIYRVNSNKPSTQYATQPKQLTGNRLDIDGLVHLLHGFGSIHHGVRHGLVRLDSLHLERTALQMRPHFC